MITAGTVSISSNCFKATKIHILIAQAVQLCSASIFINAHLFSVLEFAHLGNAAIR